MYDLVDRPIGVLPEGSRFLLWAMRAWVSTRERNACPPAKLGPAFLKVAAIDALPHFHMAMSALSSDSRAVLNFNCIHRPEISDSEAVLLHLWSDMAAGDEDRAVQVMDLLLKPEAVTNMFSAMRAALPGLNMAGLEPLIGDVQTLQGDAR